MKRRRLKIQLVYKTDVGNRSILLFSSNYISTADAITTMYDEDTVKIIRGRTPTSQNLLHGGFH